MAPKGKLSPRSTISPLNDEQVERLAARHTLVDSTQYYPTGSRTPNQLEIDIQNLKATKRLLGGVSIVLHASYKTKAWGPKQVPETGPFITAASCITMLDVFVPMMSLFHTDRRPRYIAKAEMAKWPLIGRWFQLVDMQPMQRHSGKAKQIEETSTDVLTSSRSLTVRPEGIVTRDPKKWVMSIKEGVGYIALESSRRPEHRVSLYLAVTWGTASTSHWWSWPCKSVVMCYDHALDYSDLLADMDSRGEEPPAEAVNELMWCMLKHMNTVLEEIRDEQFPAEDYWNYRSMSRKPWLEADGPSPVER